VKITKYPEECIKQCKPNWSGKKKRERSKRKKEVEKEKTENDRDKEDSRGVGNLE